MCPLLFSVDLGECVNVEISISVTDPNWQQSLRVPTIWNHANTKYHCYECNNSICAPPYERNCVIEKLVADAREVEGIAFLNLCADHTCEFWDAKDAQGRGFILKGRLHIKC